MMRQINANRKVRVRGFNKTDSPLIDYLDSNLIKVEGIVDYKIFYLKEYFLGKWNLMLVILFSHSSSLEQINKETGEIVSAFFDMYPNHETLDFAVLSNENSQEINFFDQLPGL
jgi:hypothetical protein